MGCVLLYVVQYVEARSFAAGCEICTQCTFSTNHITVATFHRTSVDLFKNNYSRFSFQISQYKFIQQQRFKIQRFHISTDKCIQEHRFQIPNSALLDYTAYKCIQEQRFQIQQFHISQHKSIQKTVSRFHITKQVRFVSVSVKAEHTNHPSRYHARQGVSPVGGQPVRGVAVVVGGVSLVGGQPARWGDQPCGGPALWRGAAGGGGGFLHDDTYLQSRSA